MTAVDDVPMSMLLQGAALVSLIWGSTVFLVQSIGLYKLYVNKAPHCLQSPVPSLHANLNLSNILVSSSL